VLMSEDLRTDHVKLESPSILTKILFCPAIGGEAGPPGPPLVYANGSCTGGELVMRQLQRLTVNRDPA